MSEEKGIVTQPGSSCDNGIHPRFIDSEQVVSSISEEALIQIVPLTLLSGQPQSGVSNDVPNQPRTLSAHFTDSEKRKLIQEFLVLLLHADRCRKKDIQASSELQKCTLPRCKATKYILSHLITCNVRIYCSVPLCGLSRNIIKHWKSCIFDCSICTPIKQMIEDNAAVSGQITHSQHPRSYLSTLHYEASSGSEGGPQFDKQYQPGVPPVSPTRVDTAKCKVNQQYLLSIIHADECQKLEKKRNGEILHCTSLECRLIKNTLTHIRTCQLGKNCFMTDCRSMWPIIRHWKMCTNADICVFCSPLKRAYNLTDFADIW